MYIFLSLKQPGIACHWWENAQIQLVLSSQSKVIVLAQLSENISLSTSFYNNGSMSNSSCLQHAGFHHTRGGELPSPLNFQTVLCHGFPSCNLNVLFFPAMCLVAWHQAAEEFQKEIGIVSQGGKPVLGSVGLLTPFCFPGCHPRQWLLQNSGRIHCFFQENLTLGQRPPPVGNGSCF